MTSQARKDMVIHWHDTGYSVDETARLLNLTEAEVIAIIQDANRRHPSIRTSSPQFIQPPAFDGD